MTAPLLTTGGRRCDSNKRRLARQRILTPVDFRLLILLTGEFYSGR